jgi:hypothetical protein
MPPDQSTLAKGKETGPVVDVTPNLFFACNQLQKLHNFTDEEFDAYLAENEKNFDLKTLNLTKEEIVRNKVGRPFVLLDHRYSSAETDLACLYLLKMPKELGDVSRLKRDLRADEEEAMQKRAKEMLLDTFQLTLDDPDYYIEQELQPDAIRYDIFRFVSNVALFQKFVSELRE